MKMEQSECSETSAHKIQTSENHPKKECKLHNTEKLWIQELNRWVITWMGNVNR